MTIPRDSDIPPDASSTPPGEWARIGDITTANGQILVIANHAHEQDGVDWILAYNVPGKSRSADGRIITFTADQIALEQLGGRAVEDALIIRTWENGHYAVDARTCGAPGHDGWCEVRINLHSQDSDVNLSDVEMTTLTATDDEKRALAETAWEDPPDSGSA